MNRVVKRLTAAVCILLMGFAVVEICGIFDNSVGLKQYTEESSIIEKNEALFNKIEQLEVYAKDYKDANPSVSATATELSLQFIRHTKYSGGGWDTLLGTVDQSFIDYIANEKDSEFKFTDNDVIYDLKTEKEIDLIHLSATLNAYYKYGEIVLFISTHYAGWAGDLLTLLTETINYRQENSITDATEIANYVNRKLATNVSSSLGSADALADLDAMNISEISTLGTEFTNTLINYYQSTDEFGNNAYNRFNTVRVKYTAKENLESIALDLLSSTLVANTILTGNDKTLYQSVTEEDKEIVAKEFAEYVFGKVYIDTSVNNIDLKVGETEELDIIEKNILEPDALRYDSSKIAVSVKDFKMNIKAVGYGTTKVDIYNGEDLLKTINITIKNVEPEVAEQPIVKEEYKAGESVEISFEANGTNNKYRWYIHDSEKGTDTFIKETSEPRINLKLEESYHNKYLKCGIINEGNTEVFTTPVKLVVKKAADPVVPGESTDGGEQGGSSEAPDQNNNNSSKEESNKGQNNKPSGNNKKDDISNPNTSPGEDVKLNGVMDSKVTKIDESTKISTVVLVVFFISIIATIVFIILAKKNKETW